MSGWRLLWAMVLAAVGTPLAAQSYTPVPAPSVLPAVVDGNGVNVVTNVFTAAMTDVSIGPSGPHGLAYARYWNGAGWWTSITATISGSTSAPVVSIGDASDGFTLKSGHYVSAQGRGATLTGGPSAGGGDYVYTSAAGTVVDFTPASSTTGSYDQFASNLARVSYILYPDGTRWTFTFRVQSYCPNGVDPCTMARSARLKSLTNNFGYQLKFGYAEDYVSSLADLGAWQQVVKATAINNAVEACDPTADSCALTGTWASASYGYDSAGGDGSGNLTSVTDPLGQVWSYSYTGGLLSGLKRPGATGSDVTVEYGGDQTVSAVTRAGVRLSYSYTSDGTTRTWRVLDASNTVLRTVASSVATQLVSSDKDGMTPANTTSYAYDASSRLDTATLPEGGATSYAYDARGNVVVVTRAPKPGSSLAAIVTSAAYPATCANQKICNQPTSTTDALRRVTDYSYDAGTGLPLTVTRPAPSSGAARPQVRYGYTTVSSGYAGGGTISLPGTISTCRTAASCAGTSDENRVTMGYAGASGNFLPSSVTRAAGDGSVSAGSSVAYDAYGNVAATTDPLGNASRAFYDLRRAVTEVVGPDPDGAGPLRNRAATTTYGPDGQVSWQRTGTSNADGSGFTALRQLLIQRDGYGRRTAALAKIGHGNTYSLTQLNYDALGRVNCVGVRMNAQTFGSEPDACTQGTAGSYGPDRITQTSYDADWRVSSVTEGVGTALARTGTTAWTADGLAAGVTDAKNNPTSYGYDGYDRLVQTCYAAVSCSGASDHEDLTYDAGSRVTSRRLRDGTSIGYAYDALDRLTAAYLPSGNNGANPSYAWDNLGEPLTASNGNGAFTTRTAFAWDALGEEVSETNAYGAVSKTTTLAYDADGRLTRLTWDDGQSAYYGYDAVGELVKVNGPGNTTVAAYAYGDAGERTAATRANPTRTDYAYDTAYRPTGVTDTLNGGTWNRTLTLGSYNPAGQVGSRVSSNDLYAFTQSYNVNRSYTANGLNQYTSISTLGSAPAYDARGNLTQAGSTTYGYTALNELGTAGNVRFDHDALGRLVYSSATGTWLERLGDRIISERDASGNVLRRYVYGADEAPAVWYEGAGTGDRRFLTTDERGSVTAVANDQGNALAVNSYDEYGIPSSTNLGRFGYTGQAWLPEVGLYDYKARTYSPTLGRFLQTDPIGYADGVNWYNYAHGDPVNGSDPTGLGSVQITYADVTTVSLNGVLSQVTFSNFHTESFDFDDDSAANLDEQGFISLVAIQAQAIEARVAALFKGFDWSKYTPPPPQKNDGDNATQQQSGDDGAAACAADPGCFTVTGQRTTQTFTSPPVVITPISLQVSANSIASPQAPRAPMPVQPANPRRPQRSTLPTKIKDGAFCFGGLTATGAGLLTSETGLGTALLLALTAAGATDSCANFVTDF